MSSQEGQGWRIHSNFCADYGGYGVWTLTCGMYRVSVFPPDVARDGIWMALVQAKWCSLGSLEELTLEGARREAEKILKGELTEGLEELEVVCG